MEKKETPAPITKEQLLDTAEDTTKKFLVLRKKFPRTANALVYSTLLKEIITREDDDILFVRNAIYQLSGGIKKNLETTLDRKFNNREEGENWNLVSEILKTIGRQVSSASPDELFQTIHEYAGKWRDQLLDPNIVSQNIGEPLRMAITSLEKYEYPVAWRLEKYRNLVVDASEELIPHLTKRPGEILEKLKATS